jgi:hypothetical protein
LIPAIAESTPIDTAKETKMEDESPRRMPPKPVRPLTLDGVRYEVVLRAHLRGFKQSGGVLVAIDEKTGKEKWIVQVYSTRLDDHEETDVQIAYITQIEPATGGVIVTNEHGERYTVDFSGKHIQQIKPVWSGNQ